MLVRRWRGWELCATFDVSERKKVEVEVEVEKTFVDEVLMAAFKKKLSWARKLVYKYSIPAAVILMEMTLFFETPSVEGADSSLPAVKKFFVCVQKKHSSRRPT